MNYLGRHIQAAGDSGVETARARNNSGRDETREPGTTGGDPVTSGAGLAIYAVIAGVALAFATVNAFSAAHDAVRRGSSYDLGTPLLWELTSVVVIVALAPLIGFSVGRLREETSWPLRLCWIAGTIVVFSALHVVGMVALRKVAVAAVGGTYDFGLSLSEFVYEFRKDVITCFLIGAGLWFGASRRNAAAEPAVAISAAPRSPDALWLRDGPKRIRVEPAEIATVSSAGNYVEYSLAGGRSHLVRGTLAAEEARLVRFSIVRVHRTRLVNLARVTAVKAGANGDFELTLDTGQSIPGSRRYRDAVSSIDALAAGATSVTGENRTLP